MLNQEIDVLLSLFFAWTKAEKRIAVRTMSIQCLLNAKKERKNNYNNRQEGERKTNDSKKGKTRNGTIERERENQIDIYIYIYRLVITRNGDGMNI